MYHIGKVGTKFEIWCDIKQKPIINKCDLFSGKSNQKYFKKLIIVSKGPITSDTIDTLIKKKKKEKKKIL